MLEVVEEDPDPLRLDAIPDGASLVHVTAERLFRVLKGQMGAVLENQGSSIVEWRVLMMLRIHGEMVQRDLVHIIGMLQAQVSRTLKVMQERGLVQARRSNQDRRAWLYSLTPAGEALYQRNAPAMARRRTLLDGVLTPVELQGFLAGAQKIAAAAIDEAAERNVTIKPT